MVRVGSVVVSVLMVVGLGLLAASTATNKWRTMNSGGTAQRSTGLFRTCTGSSTMGMDGCVDNFKTIDDISKEQLSIICMMCIALLFSLLALVSGCCSLSCKNPIHCVLAMLLLLSVAASATGLGLYFHYYSDVGTLDWSYYTGWGASGINLLGVVILGVLQCK